ncbi:hypothetical protein VIGAN_01020800 [Vigna angularis var. angularis]|uniref:Uncharacterized protein n=1 Tax=Vigna angularis var. angularis TaxID=157739 RepID=A0A0S3QWT9_PHAAN|nr:hypothetical protein VIGAN_01020800 [Vigna angularis var. angularis]
MAMGPERSKPLHNFPMPCLKWGNQRFLRCVKVADDHDDIAAVRRKLILDLRVAADNLKVSIFQEPNSKPWNLRTRRAACKAPHHTNQLNSLTQEMKKKKKTTKIEEKTKFSVSLTKEEVEHDFWALLGTRPPRRPKKRPRIIQKNLDVIIPLTPWIINYIHAFFLVILFNFWLGFVSFLQTLFPGLWLSEVTAESYEVPEVPE